jgi:hypothetical protein
MCKVWRSQMSLTTSAAPTDPLHFLLNTGLQTLISVLYFLISPLQPSQLETKGFTPYSTTCMNVTRSQRGTFVTIKTTLYICMIWPSGHGEAIVTYYRMQWCSIARRTSGSTDMACGDIGKRRSGWRVTGLIRSSRRIRTDD